MKTDGGAMFHPIQGSKITAGVANTAEPTLSPPAIVQPSPCHSPVPYLFAALVLMLGVIVFALLFLVCSYWRLSGQIPNDGVNGGQIDMEAEINSEEKSLPVSEENFLVIMAGEMKPTFLATPMISSSRPITSQQLISFYFSESSLITQKPITAFPWFDSSSWQQLGATVVSAAVPTLICAILRNQCNLSIQLFSR